MKNVDFWRGGGGCPICIIRLSKSRATGALGWRPRGRGGGGGGGATAVGQRRRADRRLAGSGKGRFGEGAVAVITVMTAFTKSIIPR